MKRFMYFSVGMVCLALSALIGFHIGSDKAEAQAPAPAIGYIAMDNLPQNASVMLENGDVYWRSIGVHPNGMRYFQGSAPSYIGNFWTSGPTASEASTWGTVKGQYNK